MKKIYLLVFLQISAINIILASDTLKVINNKFHISTTPLYGFLAPHHSYMKYYITSHVSAISIEISKKANGNKAWHKYYKNSLTGAGYFHANLGNDILGKVHALYSFINIPIVSKRHFNFNVQISSGLAYMTQKFDVDNNYLNTAIVSRINYYFNLAFDTKIKLSNNLKLKPSISLSHFSNGAIKKPNLGLNLFTGGCGIIYSFHEEKAQEKIFSDKLSKNSDLLFTYSVGTKQTFVYDDKNYFISSVTANYMRNYSPIGTWYLGADFFYDKSFEMRYEKAEQEFNTLNYYRAGVHIGHDMKISRLSIILQIGSYIFSDWKEDGWMYDRLGLRYQISKNISTHVMLKSHLEKADFVEWGIGYKFGVRK